MENYKKMDHYRCYIIKTYVIKRSHDEYTNIGAYLVKGRDFQTGTVLVSSIPTNIDKLYMTPMSWIGREEKKNDGSAIINSNKRAFLVFADKENKSTLGKNLDINEYRRIWIEIPTTYVLFIESSLKGELRDIKSGNMLLT